MATEPKQPKPQPDPQQQSAGNTTRFYLGGELMLDMATGFRNLDLCQRFGHLCAERHLIIPAEATK